MRRVSVFLITLFLISSQWVVNAQDDKLLWNLTETITYVDGGRSFSLNYPEGWVVEQGAPTFFAENQDDLKSLVDNDESTQPEGYSITLGNLAPKDLGLKADATLEEVIRTVVEAGKIAVEGEPIELPVMTRRTLTILGTNAAGRAGILTTWQQGNSFIILSMGMPEHSSDANYSWGHILGNIKPDDAMGLLLELGKEPIILPTSKLKVYYPDSWTQVSLGATASGIGIVELKEDASSLTTPKGYLITLAEFSLPDMKSVLNVEVETVDDFVKVLPEYNAMTIAEHIILDHPARVIRGEDMKNEGYWNYTAAFIMDDTAIVISAVAPGEALLDEFEPTWLWLLDNIQPAQE